MRPGSQDDDRPAPGPEKGKNAAAAVDGGADDGKPVIREYLTVQEKQEPDFTLWEHHDPVLVLRPLHTCTTGPIRELLRIG